MALTLAKWTVDEYHRLIESEVLVMLIVFREPCMGQYTSRQDYKSGSIAPLAFLDISISISDILN